MENRTIAIHDVERFEAFLIQEEKSPVTVSKYTKDVLAFIAHLHNSPVNKDAVLEYKHVLIQHYAPRSVNSKLAALCCFFSFMDWNDCKVKALKIQKEVYTPEEKELSKEEYLRLLQASKNDQRLHLLLQTICATGIRVSELKYFTVEAVGSGSVIVRCKNKNRTILIPHKLRTLLLKYAKEKKIATGAIFCTKSGNPLDRSNIWTYMRRLCACAKVLPGKVFPHNLRKLFAQTFYALEKDIAKLADILGHSSINTTRIYVMTSGTEHRRKLERMDLILTT